MSAMNAEDILNKHLAQLEAEDAREMTDGAHCAVAAGSAETPDAQINWSLRRQAAEVLLDFWQDEFCTHNDGNARVQMDRAHAMLGDVNQAEHESSPNRNQ